MQTVTFDIQTRVAAGLGLRRVPRPRRLVALAAPAPLAEQAGSGGRPVRRAGRRVAGPGLEGQDEDAGEERPVRRSALPAHAARPGSGRGQEPEGRRVPPAPHPLRPARLPVAAGRRGARARRRQLR